MAGDSLWLRIVSGAVFVPIVSYLAWRGGSGFVALVSAVVVLGLVEFYEMLRAKGERPYRATGIVAGLLLLWLSHFRGGIHAMMLVTLVLLGLMTFELLRRDNRGALHNISGTVFGVFYVAWLGGHLLFLRTLPEVIGMSAPGAGSLGAAIVLYLFACVWGCDSLAYVIGTRWGRHALLPRVSPKKSVEGAIAGIIAGGGAGWVCAVTFAPLLPPWPAALLGMLLAACGQIGDMVESLLKRDTSRKDSAVAMFIPGHGGVLDRFDSTLFAAPVLYYVLKAIYL